jgi:hypothetical protein
VEEKSTGAAGTQLARAQHRRKNGLLEAGMAVNYFAQRKDRRKGKKIKQKKGIKRGRERCEGSPFRTYAAQEQKRTPMYTYTQMSSSMDNSGVR